ncbi:MAG: hypothetical protein ACD_44C00221G0002 [uncultured bacterium]|nr:MAG: hypothetical protein ACD_44C00221G0002 [uncultured bacterium]
MTKPLIEEEKRRIISTLYPQSDNAFYDKEIESPLPFKRETTIESFLLRMASFKEAYQLIVGDEIFSNTRKSIEEKLKEASTYINRETQIKKQHGAVLYFRNYLVELLHENLKIKIKDADKQLTEAEIIYNWKKRKILFSAYKQENTDHTVVLIEEVASQPLPSSGEFQQETETGEAVSYRFFNVHNDDGWERKRINEILREPDAARTPPCNLRKLPGISNFGVHKFYVYDKKENLMGEGISLRSATFCPQSLSTEIQKAYILYNLKKFIEFVDTNESYKKNDPAFSEPYLIISFLINIPFTDERQFNKLIIEVIDEENKKREEQGKQKVLYVAHPVNHTFWRLFSLPFFYPNTYTRREKKVSSLILEEIGIHILDPKTGEKLTSWLNEYKKFFLFRRQYDDKFNGFQATISARLNFLKERLELYIKKLEELEKQATPSRKDAEEKENIKKEILSKREKILRITAIQDYVELLHKDPFSIGDKNPNLYRSALEQIIARKSIAGCKQGKDRTGIYMTHYDSMLQCFYTSPSLTLPRYFDERVNRENFSTVFCENLKTNQQAYMAGLNSQGCRGLKYMTHTMANDQIKKIKEEKPAFFEDNQIISDMNKIDYNKEKAIAPPASLGRGKKQTAKLPKTAAQETEVITFKESREFIAKRKRDELNPFLQRKKMLISAATKTETPPTTEVKTPQVK